MVRVIIIITIIIRYLISVYWVKSDIYVKITTKKSSPSRIKTRLLDNDRCIYIGKNGENKQIDKQTDTTRIQMQSQFHRNCIYFIYFLFSFRNVSICMSLCISARARQWIERLSNIRMLETYGKYGFALVCFPFMNTREYQNHKYEWSQPCIDGQPSKKKSSKKSKLSKNVSMKMLYFS